jgi:two-component system cell cycle sensor histidine kinase/response regulator CckA
MKRSIQFFRDEYLVMKSSKRYQAKEKFHTEKERFQMLSEHAPFGMVMIDKDGAFSYINPKFRELFGYDLKDIPNGETWFRKAYPDSTYRHNVISAWVDDLKRSKPGEKRPRVYTATCKDGTEKIVNFIPVQLETGENLMTCEDVGERRQAEKALQEKERFLSSIFGSIQDGISILDKDMNIIRVNPIMEKWYFHALPLIGKKCYEAYHKRNERCEICPSYRTIKTGEAAYEIVPKRGPEGEMTGWLDLYSFPLMDVETRQMRAVIEYVRDITERKRAEDELLRSEEEAKRLAQENAIMAEIGQIISSTLNIEEIYERFAEEVNKLIPFDRIAINIINPKDQTLTIAYVTGVEIEGRKTGDTIPLAGTMTEGVMRKRSTLLIQTNGKEELARRFPRLLPSIQAKFKSLLSVPLFSKDQVIGVLHIRSTKSNTYTERELKLAERVGHQIAGAIANAQLFAERKQAEQALQTERQRFQILSEYAPFGMVMIDKDGTFRYINPKFRELFGYDLKDIPNGETWFRKAYPDSTYRHNVISAWISDLKIFTPGEKRPRVFTATCKDGTEKIVNFISVQLETGKNLITCEDITQHMRFEETLRESEERYRTLFEGSRDAVYITTREGRFVDFNQAFLDLFGYSKEELMVLHAQETYVHPVDRYRFRQEIEERGFVRDYEVNLRKKDGKEMDCLLTASVRRGNDGPILGYQGIIRDITERKRAEQEMKALEEQLRQSQKMEAIGRLAGGIAHDFNNLLTIIKGYSQLSLSELKEGHPLRENLEGIQKATDRATDLIRKILAFSRRQLMEMRVLDLNTLLMDLDKLLRRIIGEDIELVTVLAEDLGRVKVDPGQIEQVILNLSVNAKDAMPNGGKLTIETANAELDEAYARNHLSVISGRYVMLSVSDTGVGMSPEVRERIFEPFYTTKEKGKGTGLGLSTVYGIVKQSGGNIWVYSEPGQGTTFKIYLPREEEPLEEIREKVVKEEFPRGSETVLVVEDEEEVRKLAVRILQKQGYKVLEASQGNEALFICEQHEEPIHLLVTDVVMPGMSGRELSERLTSLRPEIKILYMSGHTNSAIVHHGVLEPGVNLLQKPFTPEALARKVREVLER